MRANWGEREGERERDNCVVTEW